jgi:hypothetical protein
MKSITYDTGRNDNPTTCYVSALFGTQKIICSSGEALWPIPDETVIAIMKMASTIEPRINVAPRVAISGASGAL